MVCPSCGTATVAVSVPASLIELVPESTSKVACCPACLSVDWDGERADKGYSPSAFPSILPEDETVFGGLVVFFGFLPHLAMYRSELTTVLTWLEAEGIDPLLLLERVGTTPTIDPCFSVAKRRQQLEVLL